MGEISGTYNILAHKYRLARLNGDGVTRAIPTVAIAVSDEFRKNSIAAENNLLMKMTQSRTGGIRKPSTAPAPRKLDSHTSRPHTQEAVKSVIKTSSKNIVPIRIRKKESGASNFRPNTIQTPPSRQKNVKCVDYRTIKSPTLRRKAYSATLTPKTNRPQSVHEEHQKESTLDVQKKENLNSKKLNSNLIEKRFSDKFYLPSRTESTENKTSCEVVNK